MGTGAVNLKDDKKKRTIKVDIVHCKSMSSDIIRKHCVRNSHYSHFDIDL